MRTFSSAAFGLTISLLSISSTLAMGMVQKTEPVDIFLNGGNPEWAAGHAYGKASNAEHREYHKNAENKGMQIYEDAFRPFMQKRNLAHRKWHMEQAGGYPHQETMHVPTSVNVFESDFFITIVDAPQGFDRVFIGVPPSRRSLVNEIERQQQLHSLTVGQ